MHVHAFEGPRAKDRASPRFKSLKASRHQEANYVPHHRGA